MKVSRWYTRSRDHTKDITAERIIPTFSHTLNCGLLIIFDDNDRKLTITLTYAEYRELLSDMQTILDNTYANTKE